MFKYFIAINWVICCVQVSSARNYDLEGAHFLLKRQPSFYDYYNDDNPLLSSDDSVCPKLNPGLIYYGNRRFFSTIMLNNKMFIHHSYKHFYFNDGIVHFSLDVRQMFEAEPPTPCPVIEAEIRVRPDLTDMKCSLLWEESLLGYFQLFLHLVCRSFDKPDSSADYNPKRIVTLIPQKVSSPGAEDYVYYKVCPYKNRTCENMQMVVSSYGRVSYTAFDRI